MVDGRTVDTHAHVWRLADGLHPWLADPSWSSIHHDYTEETLQATLADAGVDTVVLVQAATDCAETQQLLRIADRSPWIAGVVGWVSLSDADATRRQLDSLSETSKLVGVRHMGGWQPDGDLLLEGRASEGARVLQDRGLVLDVHLPEVGHIPSVAVLARQLPELSIVLNHLGKPPWLAPAGDPVREAWFGALTDLADCPNVHIKFSGWTTPRRSLVESSQVEPYLQHVMTGFGAERVLFGSNWPVTLVSCDYATVWRESVKALAPYPDEVRAAVLGANAIRIYGL